MTSQAAVRRSFWEVHEMYAEHYRKGKRQNEYPADVRMAFVDYVDHLKRDGSISAELGYRVTL